MGIEEVNIGTVNKNIFLLLALLFVSCDPVYVGELRNNSNTEIQVKICGDDFSYIDAFKSDFDLPDFDTTKICRIYHLKHGETMSLASSSNVATPLMYEDLGFDAITIIANNRTIKASGEEIMDLFKVEKKKTH